MSRKSFIRSHNATCQNWIWSWSFIDAANKIIIFGEWDKLTRYVGTPPLFSEDWEKRGNKKQSGYKQSREHIRLIEQEDYTLKTYPLIFSDAYHDRSGDGPAKIGRFTPELTEKLLRKEGRNWYADDKQAST